MKWLRTLTIAGLAASASPSQAACTLSTTGIAFGVYNPAATVAKDVTGTITLRCDILSGLGGYQITLSQGTSGGYGSRRLRSSTDQLAYQLYVDAARTAIWGNGSSNTSFITSIVPIALLGGAVDVPVYARIPARQSVAQGSYSDTIIVTVSY